MKSKIVYPVIGVVSVVVPLLVAFLLFSPGSGKFTDMDVSFLPHLNAVLNSATALLLFIGFLFIKSGNQKLHKTAMYSAFALSAIFLISYVLYHANAEHTKYGGEGTIRYVYFFLLISHILLSVAIVPLVLFSIYFAVSGKNQKHKKIVKWTWPIWMYVAVSGVIVYFMIKPFYLT